MPNTIPELYHDSISRFGQRIASFHKDSITGSWEATTGHEGHASVVALANGLLSLGIKKGDRIGVLSETRLEWWLTDMASVCAGAITVGIYPTSTPEQSAYILNHAEIEVLFLEDRSQFNRIVEIADEVPSLKTFVLYEDAGLVSNKRKVLGLNDLLDLGEEWQEQHQNELAARQKKIKPDDVAMLVYTSGTTGPPKGVMLTHRNICETVESVADILPTRRGDLGVVFLPLAHSLQRVTGYAGLVTGSTGVFAERIDKIVDHMQQFMPTVQAAVPRIYEKIHAKILTRVHQSPPARQKIFKWALGIGRQVAKLKREHQQIPLPLRIQFKAADRLVMTKIREIFGGRVRYMVSGAAPISMELLEFFEACGIIILEGYGLTETTAPATINRLDNYRFGTVGQDLPICQTKIADDGEILIKGANVFKGYYKNPEATSEAFTEDGWFKTGDIGTKDAQGFVRITDRKKELIITAGGKNVSPANIENLVKSKSALVSQCVVYGDKQKFLVALITLEPEELETLANKLGINPNNPDKLTQHAKIIAEVQLNIDATNRELARFETIKYFRILNNELSIEDDMLTPTMKLKRRNIYKKHQSLLDEMYKNASKKRIRAGDMAI